MCWRWYSAASRPSSCNAQASLGLWRPHAQIGTPAWLLASKLANRHTGFAGTGAVTLIQRFGSALNLNIHLHMLFLDGAFSFRARGAVFQRARRPTDLELAQLLDTLSRRIVRVLERRGLLIADPEHPHLDLETGSSLDQIQAASITHDGFTRALLGLRPNRTLAPAHPCASRHRDSCPMDAAPQAGIRHRHRDLSRMRRQAPRDRLHRGSTRCLPAQPRLGPGSGHYPA